MELTPPSEVELAEHGNDDNRAGFMITEAPAHEKRGTMLLQQEQGSIEAQPGDGVATETRTAVGEGNRARPRSENWGAKARKNGLMFCRGVSGLPPNIVPFCSPG